LINFFQLEFLFFSAGIFFLQFLVIKALDPESKMLGLDPDPDEINADPQP
jgi:hypothetical protein